VRSSSSSVTVFSSHFFFLFCGDFLQSGIWRLWTPPNSPLNERRIPLETSRRDLDSRLQNHLLLRDRSLSLYFRTRRWEVAFFSLCSTAASHLWRLGVRIFWISPRGIHFVYPWCTTCKQEIFWPPIYFLINIHLKK
jgi:hypothetical protein